MGFWVSPRSPVSCAAAASGIDFTTCRVYQPEFTILVLALLCWLIPTMFVVLVRVGLRIKGYFEITETATSFLAAKHKYLTYRSYAIEDGKVFLLASGSSSSSKLRRIELPLEIATKFLGSEYVTARNESIIAGSLQIPVASLPSGQFTLSTGGFVFASCFLTRHNNKFVLATPYHAVEQMRSYDSVDVSDGKRSCALSKKWKMVAGSAQLDFAFIHVPQSLQTFFECKVIKMAAARSGPVSICAMDNSGQVFLSRGRAKFAKVPFVLQHTCSTVPIYSGAPLMSGKTCIGMHVRNVTREFNEAIAIGHLFQHLYKSKNESDFVVNDWRREDSDSDSEQEEDRADRFAAQLYDEERHFFMEMRDGVYSLDDDHEFNPQFRSLHERSWADEMEELDIEQEDYFRYHGYESLPMRSGPGNESLNPMGLASLKNAESKIADLERQIAEKSALLKLDRTKISCVMRALALNRRERLKTEAAARKAEMEAEHELRRQAKALQKSANLRKQSLVLAISLLKRKSAERKAFIKRVLIKWVRANRKAKKQELAATLKFARALPLPPITPSEIDVQDLLDRANAKIAELEIFLAGTGTSRPSVKKARKSRTVYEFSSFAASEASDSEVSVSPRKIRSKKSSQKSPVLVGPQPQQTTSALPSGSIVHTSVGNEAASLPPCDVLQWTTVTGRSSKAGSAYSPPNWSHDQKCMFIALEETMKRERIPVSRIVSDITSSPNAPPPQVSRPLLARLSQVQRYYAQNPGLFEDRWTQVLVQYFGQKRRFTESRTYSRAVKVSGPVRGSNSLPLSSKRGWVGANESYKEYGQRLAKKVPPPVPNKPVHLLLN
nr:MAG: hypothetical protein 1 [Barnaviridae sp.]